MIAPPLISPGRAIAKHRTALQSHQVSAASLPWTVARQRLDKLDEVMHGQKETDEEDCRQ